VSTEFKSARQPLAENIVSVAFDGAEFVVGIDYLAPEGNEVVHPDNYWIDSIKLGSVWWSACDVLSEPLLDALNAALSADIAQTHKDAA
jgi:hypothetical protein